MLRSRVVERRSTGVRREPDTFGRQQWSEFGESQQSDMIDCERTVVRSPEKCWWRQHLRRRDAGLCTRQRRTAFLGGCDL